MFTANDIKGVNQLSGELGGGTLIRIKDGTMILQPEFRDYLIKLAEDNHINYQYYISPGGTDGGEIHKANIGIPTAELVFVLDIFTVRMQFLILEITILLDNYLNKLY